MKIRSHLLLLAAGILLPVLVFSGIMMAVFWQVQRQALESGHLERARSLAAAVDRELDGTVRLLQVLAQSKDLAAGDVRAFADHARAVVTAEGWKTVVLLDPAGRPLLDLRQPLDGVPPADARFAWALQETPAAAVSRLLPDPAGGWATYVGVPVREGERLRYLLLAGTDHATWLAFLSRHPGAGDATMTLLDQDGTVIARTRDGAAWVGKRPATDLFQRARERGEGVYRGADPDGLASYLAHSRARLGGWTAASGVAAERAEAPLMRSLVGMGGGQALAVLIAVALAFVAGRRIARPVSSLAGLAGSVAGESDPQPDRSPRHVTEVREVERALRRAIVEARTRAETVARSEAQYRSLVAATSSVIWTADATGAFSEHQPSWEAYTGQPFEAHRGSGWMDAVHPEDRPAVEAAWHEALADQGTLQVEARIWCAEHRQFRHCVARAAPVPNADGTVGLWSGTLTDVHEPRVADEARRLSDARFAVLARLAPAGLFQTDAEGGYEYVNDRWAELMGVPVDGAASTRWLEAIDAADRDAVAATWADAVRARRPFAARFRVARAEGGPRWMQSRALPVRDATGVLISYIGVLFDVTDEQRAAERQEARLEQAETARAEAEAASQAKDDFLGVVSHELRNPLNSIKLWLEVLRQQPADSPLSRRALEGIERNTMSQAQLVDELLDISRIVSGKLHMRTDTVLLGPIIASALDAARPAATAKGVTLDMTLDAPPAPVVGDPERLHQVVLNLVSNAVKFTPKGGRVWVTLTPGDSTARVVIADTGDGIDPVFMPHVFERFRQADSTSRRAVSGLGLGLSIARRLVELHGGRIWAESAGPGKGATFFIELPLAAAAERTGPAVTAGVGRPREQTSLDGLRLLVVEDDPSSREGLALVLRAAGARVTAVDSAPAALGALDEEHYDVMVSDIGMPGQDGYDLMRALRVRPPERGGRTRSIALTAYASLEDRRRALACGYEVHLAKPVSPPVLTGAIAALAASPPPDRARDGAHLPLHGAGG